MYKKSKYNYIVEKENKIFIYNFLHRTFIKIDKDTWEKSLFDEDMTETLLYYGILHDSKLDEYSILRNVMNNELYSKKSLGIFLSMTSQCNFNCPYCYQDSRKDMKKNIFIEKEKVNVLYEYLQKYIKKNSVENLSVVFFGGEPTLNEEKLVYAIDKINSLDNVNKTFSIITNGYLIGDRLMEKLKNIENL